MTGDISYSYGQTRYIILSTCSLLKKSEAKMAGYWQYSQSINMQMMSSKSCQLDQTSMQHLVNKGFIII